MENNAKVIKERGIESSKRIVWVDLVKGYAMLFVMLHHVTFTPMVYRTFYAPFFLTAFFVVAGYTFSSKRPFGQFFLRKCKTLLIPLFSLGIICILMSQVLSFNEQERFVQQIADLLIQDGTSGHRLWFIAAIFTACMLFYPISKLKKRLFVLSCVSLAVLNIIFNKYICHTYLPWHLSVVGLACFWMGIGYYVKRFICPDVFLKVMESKKTVLVTASIYCLCLLLSCMLFRTDYVGFSDFTKHPIMYFLLNSLGTLLLICLCNQKHFICLSKFIVFIGQNTLFYFAFHGKVQSLLMTVITKIGFVHLFENYRYISAPMLVIVEAIIMILPCIVFKMKFPILVGK